MLSKFFKKHPEFTLYFLATLFIGIVVGFYFFGIVFLANWLDRAISIDTEHQTGSASTFDIKGAEGINLKGLVR